MEDLHNKVELHLILRVKDKTSFQEDLQHRAHKEELHHIHSVKIKVLLQEDLQQVLNQEEHLLIHHKGKLKCLQHLLVSDQLLTP
jgi:hypothetical protein